MYRATVDFARSIPIFLSSPVMRGAPHSGLADDIFRIRSRTSIEIPGRPGFPEGESFLQYSRNFRRRQAMTVAGWTITRASRHADQTRDNHDQKIRSLE